MQSYWLAAAPDLRKLVGESRWAGWLAQCRLLGCDGDTWVLWLPPGNVSRAYAERWGMQIAALLAAICSRWIGLRFTTRL